MEHVVLIIIALGLLCAVAAAAAMIVRRTEREKERILKEAAEVRTEFLSRVSYDIKTPMNAIMGTVALGMEDTEDPEKMKLCLGRIQTASEFLMGLINDLLDMSKIETGRFHLHPRPYAFSDFRQEIRMLLEPSCRKKGIVLNMPQDEISINMMVDPMRFQQIFVNLLTNAVKYTQTGGEVSFLVRNYATHNNKFSADYVVRDNGIGISREFQQILFEPFTQETGEQAGKKNGAGLGLAIARNIVDLMGGTIEVHSELRKGTEVKVHLEVEIAAIQPEKANEWRGEDQTRKILKGKRVLLVEDHPMDVEIFRRILEKQEMHVIWAENGQMAVELFRYEKPEFFDLILMDLYMPKMGGFEAARKIRRIAHPDAQIIPIIAMSADDSREDLNQCREAGMNAAVSKPVEPKKLYQVMCEYLQNPV